MGCGLSGAIGASFASPGTRTVLMENDGGFTQNLQELANAPDESGSDRRGRAARPHPPRTRRAWCNVMNKIERQMTDILRQRDYYGRIFQEDARRIDMLESRWKVLNGAS
jgi:hypothetical protein